MRLRHRLNVPAGELAGRRQTSVSAVEPPKKRVLCTPRMRRNQKDFFHPLNRRAGAAPQKDNLKESLPFGQSLSYKSHKSYKSQKCACGTV